MKVNKTLFSGSGCFDHIHIGHARLFQEAKELEDKFVVMLTEQQSLVETKIMV